MKQDSHKVRQNHIAYTERAAANVAALFQTQPHQIVSFRYPMRPYDFDEFSIPHSAANRFSTPLSVELPYGERLLYR